MTLDSNVETETAPQRVIEFWKNAGPKQWFAKDAGFDKRFRDAFYTAHFYAARRELEHWSAAPDSALALLILLDQYPRNAFRGTAHMFATDPLARFYARQMIDGGMDRQVAADLRIFCYLPFEHSEDPVDQQLSLQLHQGLEPQDFKWAKEHADIIEAFGRFPHRNEVLGRVTTQAERAYLESGGFAG
ncbi:DUF924 family protein [Pseudomonas lundensis]|uniref:DUF924 family protein n=1 Tax=Pseudomonas lundensis TaxID=86185 RepID=UPI00147320D2|nr:DUF924 family protein [Pseudomonas lundensis]MCT8953196.1 DUF924 family protein [Pseudomonas lundensis]NNA34364.1 DUF924 family protein [Pseudomonas lundensis]